VNARRIKCITHTVRGTCILCFCCSVSWFECIGCCRKNRRSFNGYLRLTVSHKKHDFCHAGYAVSRSVWITKKSGARTNLRQGISTNPRKIVENQTVDNSWQTREVWQSYWNHMNIFIHQENPVATKKNKQTYWVKYIHKIMKHRAYRHGRHLFASACSKRTTWPVTR